MIQRVDPYLLTSTRDESECMKMRIEDIMNGLCAEKGRSEKLYSVQMFREKVAQMDEPITLSEDGLWLVPLRRTW